MKVRLILNGVSHALFLCAHYLSFPNGRSSRPQTQPFSTNVSKERLTERKIIVLVSLGSKIESYSWNGVSHLPVTHTGRTGGMGHPVASLCLVREIRHAVTVLFRVTLAIKVAYITVSVHLDTPPPHYTVIDSVSHNDFVSLFLFTLGTALLLFPRHLPRFLHRKYGLPTAKQFILLSSFKQSNTYNRRCLFKKLIKVGWNITSSISRESYNSSEIL